MAKLNELLKDLPIIGEYLRGDEEEEEKKEPILPEVHEPEHHSKLIHTKSLDRHRNKLKHRFSLQEHLISSDWSRDKQHEEPTRSDAEREAKLFSKFSYANPNSHQNSPLVVERRKSDDAMRHQREKSEYLQQIRSQIDKNAEEELPSVTQIRSDDEHVIPLVPLKMRQAKSSNEEEERRRTSSPRHDDEAAKQIEESPRPFSNMDFERDSIVDQALRFEKKTGLLTPAEDETDKSTSAVSNPDIHAESDDIKQERPSYEDYETEKNSYSSRRDVDDHVRRAEEERYSEEPRPANPEQRIAELQTPGYDRGKPSTSVIPKSEESEQDDDDSAYIEAPEESISESRLAEKINAPEKSAQLRAAEAMADSGGRLEDIKEEEEPVRSSRFKCTSCQKKEALENEKLNDDTIVNLEEIINYMNKQKSILDELIDQEDQKRLQIALSVARDLKLLGKEAVETLKKDLAHYFKLGNEKWKRASDEMEKLGPMIKDIESRSNDDDHDHHS